MNDLKRGLFLLLLLVTHGKCYRPLPPFPPPPPASGCLSEYNDSSCFYNVVCTDYTEGHMITYEYNTNRQRQYNQYGEIEYDESGVRGIHEKCDGYKILYDGQTFSPIQLKYKVTNPTTFINIESKSNSYNQYTTDWYPLIVHLDISSNNIEVTPDLSVKMNNIASFNISNNQLTVAKLYNTYEIATLSEIDFSFNMITAIEVNPYENVYKNLKYLNLSHNYLVEVPDAIFDSFTQLEKLDLSNNYIDTLSISTFEGIKKLTSLYISHNRITEINYSFFRFSELTSLDLSNNRIENVNLHDFEKLTKLETIDFSSNSIISIEKYALSKLSFLKSIDLHDNKLKVLFSETFENTSSLYKVDLSINDFNELPTGLLKGKNVGIFQINGNNLRGSLSRGMFEGLGLVNKLDLSYQHLTTIEDYAFLGLKNLNTLLLNNNQIHSLSNNCLRTLYNLNTLDLSGNNLTELAFDTKDLGSLRLLQLKDNHLTQYKHEQFQGLTLLHFLDLSNNDISKFESKSFKSLRDLVNFKVSNNPLKGTLEAKTFEGLNSLPSLVISGTNLTTVTNGSFTGMTRLTELNMSHSQINELQYDAFADTGGIEILDLSFNLLSTFNVNSTDLVNLHVILLHNNLLKTVAKLYFSGLSRLRKINLSYNNVKNIHDDAFNEQRDLDTLDLSYNPDLKFDVLIIAKNKNLINLCLSGTKNEIMFEAIEGTQLTVLEISSSKITNVTKINLKELTRLENLLLSNNDIVNLEVGAFTNVSQLRYLDISQNKLTFIQPGVFIDNIRLISLNISHNSLTVVSYGIFRGLIYLESLDMSYNYINSLESERFYEVRSLSKLIVDHNKINSIDAEDFVGTSLSTLSIGGNPLPCEILVNFRNKPSTFTITAITLDEHTGENIDGVTCNMNGFSYKKHINSSKSDENQNLLIDIKEQLIKIANKNTGYEHPVPQNEEFLLYFNITGQMEKIVAKYDQNLSNLTMQLVKENNSTNMLMDKLLNSLNLIMQLVEENNNTNLLLGKILNSINRKPVAVTTPFSISKDLSRENATNDLVMYINQVKEELENAIAAEKESILKEVEDKVAIYNAQIPTTHLPNTSPVQDKLMANKEIVENDRSSVFTETCVALILVILVCLVLYKFYKSRMFIRVRRSYSTRELPGAMESPNL